MKKVLLLTLLIVFLLPSCVGLAMLDEKQFSMYMKGINIITKGSMMITEQILKTIGDCKEKCKTIKENSDEWCNCMDECYRMKYDSPDENITFCLSDSTVNNQSKKESNQQNVTILTRYMTVTGTIIKYDDEKVIIYGAASGMPGNINISNSNIELSIKDILLIDYGIKTIYKNEMDSTKKADLLNKLNKIFPEGI